MNKNKPLIFKNSTTMPPNPTIHGCEVLASVNTCKGSRLRLERKDLNYDSIHETLTLPLPSPTCWCFHCLSFHSSLISFPVNSYSDEPSNGEYCFDPSNVLIHFKGPYILHRQSSQSKKIIISNNIFKGFSVRIMNAKSCFTELWMSRHR